MKFYFIYLNLFLIFFVTSITIQRDSPDTNDENRLLNYKYKILLINQKNSNKINSNENNFFKNKTNKYLENYSKSDLTEKNTSVNLDFRKLEELNHDKHINSSITYICKDNSSCNFHGRCINTTHCQCDNYYTTFYRKDLMKFNFTQCNYKQLSKKTLFSLSFFLGPLSFEHILMGNIVMGIFKLVFPMLIILIGNSVFILGRMKNNLKFQLFGKIFELIATIMIILWWLIDWLLILSDYYKDNKKVDFFDDF